MILHDLSKGQRVNSLNLL